MMKNITPKQKSQSRGMVIAIVFGLLAVSTAAYIGVKNTADEVRKQQETPSVSDSTASIPDESEDWRNYAEQNAETAEQTMTEPKQEQQKDESQKDAPKSNTLTGFVLPVEGEIINPYSNGEMVKSLTLNDWRTHDGVDIAADKGTPVKACNSGTVESVSIDPLWGTTVVLSHTDGTKSYYMGLDKSVPVSKGQQVALGEVIGNVGDTAEIEQALPSHLHFAMKKNGNWVDPTGNQSTPSTQNSEK